MKVKIHRDDVRRIISEELDRLDLVYEKIARIDRGVGHRQVRTRLADDEIDRCDTTTQRTASGALHSSLRADFLDIQEDINDAVRSKPEFEDLKGKIKYITYESYSDDGEDALDSDDALSGINTGSPDDMSDWGDGPERFDLINSLEPTDCCPGSWAFRVKIEGESGSSYDEAETRFYQEVNRIVANYGSFNMRQPIAYNVGPANAFDSIPTLTKEIQFVDGVGAPGKTELYASWRRCKWNENSNLCHPDGTPFTGDPSVIDDLMGTTSSDDLIRCPETDDEELETSDVDVSEPAAGAAAAMMTPEIKAVNAGTLSQWIENWWRNNGGDVHNEPGYYFGRFKAGYVGFDDTEGAFAYYSTDDDGWPSSRVSDIGPVPGTLTSDLPDSDHPDILNAVLAAIGEQMTDYVINNVSWTVDGDPSGTEYDISDDWLDI